MIHKVIDKHAPLKQMSRKQKKLLSKPSITKSVYESIRLRNIMYKTHYLSNDDAKKRECKIFANKLTKTNALAKKRFYAEELENNKNNSRKTWELLRTLLPGKSSKDSPLPQNITIQGNTITNQQQILEEFNNFFSKIGEKLASEFATNDEELFKRFLSRRVAPSIFLKPPRDNEDIVAINSLNFCKSFGHDDIPPFFLRTACCVLAPTLCYFVDNAFRLGIFPRSCKIAKIVPLFKTGKTEELTNYRPISILTCFSKIFEKLIYSRLISFFQKNSILHDSQYGFRNGMSTTHAALDVLTSTCDQINNEQYTGLYF